MKKRLLSLALAATMAMGMTAPAVAAGQTFSDVPESFWGYADIEAAAAAGLMNGTGNGEFSPNLKVSVAQFLTLLGRLVFPDTKVNEGDTWYGPYVAAAQNGGLLTGTQVDTNNVEAEISRYDMAVILRAAAKKLGVAEKVAQQSEVTDFGLVPNMYTDAVLAVYGMGLIKGDQAGNFNGSSTMTRSEVATVIMRLAKAKPGSTTTEPEKPVESEKPTTVTTEPKYTYLAEAGCAPRPDYDPTSVQMVEGDSVWIDRGFRTEEVKSTGYAAYMYFRVGDTFQFALQKVPVGYGYAEGDLNEQVQYWLGQIDPEWNGTEFTDFKIWTSDNSDVVTVDENGVITAVGPGVTRIRVQIPVREYNKFWGTKTDSIDLYVDP